MGPEGSQVLYDAQGNAVIVSPNGMIIAQHRQVPGDLSPEVIAHHTKSARKAKTSTEHCPACGSGDYSVIGTVFTKNNGQVESKRCFDCGYPVEQRFSGMAGLTTGGQTAGRTRQVEHGGTQNNFSSKDTHAPSFAAEQGGPGR